MNDPNQNPKAVDLTHKLILLLRISGLALTFLPSLLVFAGHLPFDTHKTWMLIGFLLWFGPATIQPEKRKK